LMQQQMFDQFHQMMLMLVQTLTTMHRDQMDLIREELAQVQRITNELYALKRDLQNQPPPGEAPPPDAPAPPARGPAAWPAGGVGPFPCPGEDAPDHPGGVRLLV